MSLMYTPAPEKRCSYCPEEAVTVTHEGATATLACEEHTAKAFVDHVRIPRTLFLHDGATVDASDWMPEAMAKAPSLNVKSSA